MVNTIILHLNNSLFKEVMKICSIHQQFYRFSLVATATAENLDFEQEPVGEFSSAVCRVHWIGYKKAGR